tara:strand:- start:428 stop:1084 length:657 start_codon:yes stop_codon:yes gene_type:complete
MAAKIFNKMIGIIDTESQNIGSIENCLKFLKIKFDIINHPKSIKNYHKIILPGVGSFDAVTNSLKQKNFFKYDLKNIFSKKQILAICVGLQVLFTKSDEGKNKGINFFNGKINSLKKMKCLEPVPHVGYNSIKLSKKNVQLSKILEKDFYFTHSYALEKKIFDNSFRGNYGTTRYGKVEFISLIEYQNILATQFHPEKSGEAGLNLLKYFYEKKKNNF